MRSPCTRAAFTVVLGLAAVTAPAFAEDEEVVDAEEEDDGEDDGEEETLVVGEDDPKPKKKKKQQFKKQDLRGHAVESSSAKNVFEKDRFFVDKVDTKKTRKRTLIQGSVTSSSFIYTESGGDLPNDMGSAAGKYSRMFTDLRLQTDFRHIGGSRWDARIDSRARLVNSADPVSVNGGGDPRIQSGFNGSNEYDVREAWIVRSGKRSDIFLGRQFITDLGALKIDGVRVDYAKSEKLTFIAFGGLYPIRGSRSLTTDYKPLIGDNGESAGRLVGAGGFGTAYRTLNMHGAIGGVAIAPLSSEAPRVYATSNGYYRGGSKLDLYHFAIIDVAGSAALSLTNLSAGANYKPAQRLRVTASFNRVDTETLNVQANAFLQPSDALGGAGAKIQNETFLTRLSTNVARAGVSAGLGPLQRFEISTAVSYRLRPAVTLTAADGMTTIDLGAATGVDVYFALTDRRSFADLRLGVDGSRSFAVGSVAYQRSEVLAARAFAARELANGRGEWEVEAGYSNSKDSSGGAECLTGTSIEQCFGASTSTVISVGGNLYYRINRDWFVLGNLFLSRQNVTTLAGADPAITGITGFGRVAYRF